MAGTNHFSRECPKGDDGAGVKGGGKNNGKVTTCFNCGAVEHRAAPCATSVREVEYEEEEDGGKGDVGGLGRLRAGGGCAAAVLPTLACLPAAATAFACWVFTTVELPGTGHGGGDQKTRSMDASH